MLAADIAAPLMDRAAIEARLDLVQRFHDDAGLRDGCAPRCAPPRHRPRAGRLAAGRGSPRDLGQLRDGLDARCTLHERLAALDDRPPCSTSSPRGCAATAR